MAHVPGQLDFSIIEEKRRGVLQSSPEVATLSVPGCSLRPTSACRMITMPKWPEWRKPAWNTRKSAEPSGGRSKMFMVLSGMQETPFVFPNYSLQILRAYDGSNSSHLHTFIKLCSRFMFIILYARVNERAKNKTGVLT